MRAMNDEIPLPDKIDRLIASGFKFDSTRRIPCKSARAAVYIDDRFYAGFNTVEDAVEAVRDWERVQWPGIAGKRVVVR